MALTGYPTVTDDDGSFTLGTVFNAAYNTALKDSIEASMFSATNPTISPAAAIDEIVNARGSKASLDARLDVAINEDGTLKAQAGQATVSEVQGIVGQGNWVANDNGQIWPGADSEAPALWTLNTLTIDRETTTVKVGDHSIKLTRGGSDGDLSQDLMSAAQWTVNGDYYKGKTFAFGGWVYTAVASAVRIQIDDGVTTSETSYHPGDSTWDFLAAEHTVSNSATKLEITLQFLNSNGDAFFNGITVVPSEGGLALTEWIPCRTQVGAVAFKYPGTLGTGTAVNNDRLRLILPWMLLGVDLFAETGPTGAALIVDINQWDGSAWQSAYTTKPQIDAGADVSGFDRPDGTYAYRCFDGLSGTGITDSQLAWDVDQIGSTIEGADVTLKIAIMQFVPPQTPLQYVGV